MGIACSAQIDHATRLRFSCIEGNIAALLEETVNKNEKCNVFVTENPFLITVYSRFVDF